jgi:hypothetical protein
MDQGLQIFMSNPNHIIPQGCGSLCLKLTDNDDQSIQVEIWPLVKYALNIMHNHPQMEIIHTLNRWIKSTRRGARGKYHMLWLQLWPWTNYRMHLLLRSWWIKKFHNNSSPKIGLWQKYYLSCWRQGQPVQPCVGQSAQATADGARTNKLLAGGRLPGGV